LELVVRPAAQPEPAAPGLQLRPSRRSVALLDVDPDLGAGMTPERFAMARREIRAVPLTLRRGEWSPEEAGSLNCSHVGLLVLDGVLAREIVIEDTISTELLGPGDFIRPWFDDESSLLRQRVRWQVLAEARTAVIGGSLAKAVRRYPELSEALTDRALARSQRLATTSRRRSRRSSARGRSGAARTRPGC
jgi:CRP/FNR family transcriptional regulator, cyclic AMP receptor protein